MLYIQGIEIVFAQSQLTVLESARFISVDLNLIGGSSATPFNVLVIPREQSPVSAEGNMMYYCVLTEELPLGDVDFNATEQTVEFAARTRSSRATIQILTDDFVEAQEMFNLTITIPPSLTRITVGDPGTAVVTIVDTTSKCRHSTCSLCIVMPLQELLWSLTSQRTLLLNSHVKLS